MLLLRQGDEFDNLLRTCEREAFHLEVQDTYETSEEFEPFERFKAGESDDFAWMEGWTRLVRETTSRGVHVRRARVVTVPHVPYTAWGLVVAQVNIEAGEEIRYLPRNRIDPGQLTVDDWWLFDGESVAFTVFEPSGQWAGGALTNDPRIVNYCREVRDLVWSAAIPHADYTAFGVR
ncbi:hypothetical protein NDR87_17865 [Nocardia sp. CDC159]|uniref:DUF6879 domain-containing protein n=1 Tax=Nocardia pulmonis TaxID=2951408 RepID=A0A9X2IZA1_9NOCA|nr:MULTISPECIES: DUF6879 family protein [Nocardia]MCM6775795.1 hypothetical protein [Nocardia pulmonis]MCM6788229.1 hypothetical protein [Nocardia sp. CDC159]